MRWALLVGALVACSGGGTANKDGGGTTTTPQDRFAQFVNTDHPLSGDPSCFTPSDDPTWLTADLDPAKVATFPIAGGVEDFQEGTPVASATVDLFEGDLVSGTPDDSEVSDASGLVSLTGPSCQPVSYRVTTAAGPIVTKTTYKQHQIYGVPTGTSIEDASYLSVSDVTYQLIPGILGIEVQPDLGIVAGTAYDCSRDPSQDIDDPAGKIEGAQVVVYDEDGNIPDTLSVNYFIDEFPARDQAYTSADGLWVASNVPPGHLTIEMWGNVDGELVKLGATEVDSEADTIAIANVFAGYGDGVKGPASCATGTAR